MSKKKEINLKSTPAAVESGDVNISYNNVLVGSLSDSGTAVLKTEMTICEHDIELEYTKPAGGSEFPEISVTNNTSLDNSSIEIEHSIKRNPLVLDNPPWIIAPYIGGATNFVPQWDYRGAQYKADGLIASNTDDYAITVNGISVPFDVDASAYSFMVFFDNYLTPLTIVINNKE